MKNVFKGGLKSLIPNRKLKDPDDILDEIDNGVEDATEAIADADIEDVEEVSINIGKKVAIVSEEEIPSESNATVKPLAKKVVAKEQDETEEEEIFLEDEEEESEIKINTTKEEEQPQTEETEENEEKPTEVEVEVEEAEEIEKDEDEKEPKAPEKPKVTPLEIDIDDQTADLELKQKTARQKAITKKVATAAKVIAKAPVTEKATVSKKATEAEQPVKSVKEVSPESEIWDKHEDNVQHLLVKKIAINPNQPRRNFDEAEMEELKNSIRQHGILQPLVVRRIDANKYELVAGERRLRAARDLKWSKVPCVVRRNVTSGASRLELALIENIQREDLNPVEEALAYRQLNEEYGMTHEEIGERVGRSRVGITNIIRVLQLPEEIQKGLSDNKITSGHAKAILMIPDSEKQLRFYRHLIEEGLTVRKAETRARRIQRTMRLDDPMRRKRKGRSAFEVKYSGLLEDRYGQDAKLKFSEEKNRYEVLFRCYSKAEIDELLARLMGDEPLPSSSQDKDVIEEESDTE